MEADWNARGDTAQTERLKDWLESQRTVLAFWKDRLTDAADDRMLCQVERHERNLEQLIGSLS